MAGSSWQDLMNQAETAGQPVPANTYDVQVVKAEYKKASTGSDMIVAVMHVQGGPHHGQPIWNNFVMTDNPANLGFFFDHMAAFGLGPAYFAQLPPPDQGGMAALAQALVGRTARATVSIEQRAGRMRNKLEGLVPSGAAPATPAVSAAPAPAPAPPAPAPAPAPAVPAPPPAPAPPAPPAVPMPPPPVPPAPAYPTPPAPPAPVAPAPAPVAPAPAPAPAPGPPADYNEAPF